MVTKGNSLLPRLLLVPDDELEFDTIECEECGFEVDIPEDWSTPFEIEKMICSTCWAVRAEEFRQKKLRELHRPDPNLPAPIPTVLALPPKKRDQLRLF